MFRVNIFTLFLTIVLILYYSTLNLFLYIFNGYSFITDLNSRLNLNDSILNMFNFFWTSFQYLPLFFFVWLALFTIFLTLHRGLSLLFLLVFFYIMYMFESVDFLSTNLNYFILTTNTSSINLLLVNNLNKYHPYIFYISVFLLFVLYYYLFYPQFRTTIFTNNMSLYNVLFLSNNIIVWNWLALILGGWWALQEGTWGGWWNWDSSEVLGLLISLWSLTVIHFKRTPSNIKQLSYFIFLGIKITIISYFFIQLNFDLVSHNFGSKFFFFFNNDLFFLEMLGFFCITVLIWTIFLNLIRTFSSCFQSTTLRLESKVKTILWYLLLMVYLLVTITLFSSFTPLISYFFWNYTLIDSLHVNELRITLILVALNLFMLFFLSPFMWKVLYTTILLIFLNQSLILLLLIPLLLTSLYSSKLHIAFLTIFWLNLYSYWINFLLPFLSSGYSNLFFSESFIEINQLLLSCDGVFIDQSLIYCDNKNTFLSSWDTTYDSNTSSLGVFLLLFNQQNFYNCFALVEGWVTPYIFIETNLLNNLSNIWFYTIILVLINQVFFFWEKNYNF